MDNYRMNHGGCRTNMQNNCQQQMRRYNCQQPSSCSNTKNHEELFHHLDDHFPVAMGYVPYQRWGNTFELCKALQIGTIFPDLHKPFCGKGGGVCL